MGCIAGKSGRGSGEGGGVSPEMLAPSPPPPPAGQRMSVGENPPSFLDTSPSRKQGNNSHQTMMMYNP